MGINVKSRKSNENKNIPIVQVDLGKDLKACMRCRYFHGNNSQCIMKECVMELKREQQEEIDGNHICFQCSYRQSDSYCFPCMKKILGKEKNNIQYEKSEEKQNGTY